MKVSFYGRHPAESETKYMKQCLASSLETDGFFLKKLLSEAGKRFPSSQCLFTASCSSALETALASLDLEPGDEVILPSFNFPSAANSVLLHGGIPVLCDIDRNTQNLSVADVSRRITGKTRAVIAVDYAGVAFDVEALRAVTDEAGLVLIEDAAQGIGSAYDGKPLGTLGDMGAVSFHHTKNITCGEGGMLLVQRQKYFEACRMYRLHGTNRASFLAGDVKLYSWCRKGSSTALGEPSAAILAAQFEVLSEVTERRRAIADVYIERLACLESQGAARLMKVPEKAEINGHIFYLRFETERLRRQVQEYLLSREIECSTHYVPLHASPMGKILGYGEKDLPESLACGKTLLRLPIHSQMDLQQAECVAEQVKRGVNHGM